MNLCYTACEHRSQGTAFSSQNLPGYTLIFSNPVASDGMQRQQQSKAMRCPQRQPWQAHQLPAWQLSAVVEQQVSSPEQLHYARQSQTAVQSVCTCMRSSWEAQLHYKPQTLVCKSLSLPHSDMPLQSIANQLYKYAIDSAHAC